MALLDDIEAFLAQQEMSATALGAAALGDRHFVRQLRAGRRVWPETERKVREFMWKHVACDLVSSELEESATGQTSNKSGQQERSAA